MFESNNLELTPEVCELLVFLDYASRMKILIEKQGGGFIYRTAYMATEEFFNIYG